MRIYTFIAFLGFAFNIHAQGYYFKQDQSVSMELDGKQLLNPWAGGINSAQLSKIDLNNDGIEDLFIYDKTCNKISTFIAKELNGSYYFKYEPKLEVLFPPIDSWVLLLDYNQDGKKDIFCGVFGGDVKVYKNKTSNGLLTLELVTEQVQTEGLSGNLPLYVSQSDIPSFTDIDNDGDIDMLAFDGSSGHFVQYHKNLSMEKYGHTDSLNYKRIGDCWGNFMKTETCGQMEFGIDCGTGQGQRTLHTGSTILALDLDNDLDKDIISGNVSCSNINVLMNNGNPNLAHFTSSTTNYPNSDDKPAINNFLAAFYEDVDFDNIKDLIVSPNLTFNEGNLTPFHESVWFYHNNGTNVPAFQLSKRNFLQDEMIDLGEYTYPALADADGDGDLDLFVGNGGKLYPDRSFYSTISLFENIGSKSIPSFKLVNSDYLGLASLKQLNIKPVFYDINKDNKLDFVYTSTNPSTLKAAISYIINTAAQGISVNNANSVDINFQFNNYDTPALTDVDNDGKMDMLLSKSQGRLEYYTNNGTNTNPSFTLLNNKAGGIDNSINAKNLTSTVVNLDKDNATELILSDRDGNLRISYNWQEHLDDIFVTEQDILYDEINDIYKKPLLGKEVFPAVGDLNDDGFAEIILGTNAGGLIYLSNQKAILGEENEASKNSFQVYPNPAYQNVTVKTNATGTIEFFSVTGQKILSKDIVGNTNDFDISFLPKGLYILKFHRKNKAVETKKLIVGEK